LPAIVGGRYRVLKPLGEGAVGAVYLAEHVHMRKRGAVKVLHRDVATPEVVWRFRAEAIAAANIGHPGIAAATDFGELPDGSMYLVLEYVAGEPLSAVIERGPLDLRRALRIARNVLSALAAAHRKGIVHRDVKPPNIMVSDGDAAVKLLDFGIAHLDDRLAGDDRVTRLGLIYGTADYMAPEQASGSPIDARADLYAVGAMLFEMISGRPPFVGSAFEVLAAHVSTPSPPLGGPAPRSITREVNELVAELLAKRPDARPADAKAAIALVDRALASLDRPETRIAGPLPTTPPRRRTRMIVAAALFTAIAAIALTPRAEVVSTIVGTHVRHEAPTPPAPTPVIAAPPPKAKPQPPKKAAKKQTGGLRAKLRAIFS
jgi:serine/threonine-protein kinase